MKRASAGLRDAGCKIRVVSEKTMASRDRNKKMARGHGQSLVDRGESCARALWRPEEEKKDPPGPFVAPVASKWVLLTFCIAKKDDHAPRHIIVAIKEKNKKICATKRHGQKGVFFPIVSLWRGAHTLWPTKRLVAAEVQDHVDDVAVGQTVRGEVAVVAHGPAGILEGLLLGAHPGNVGIEGLERAHRP